MLIRHKGIEHENTTDAPFVSARISSVWCKFKCKGCQNKAFLKTTPIITSTAKEIIAEVKSNPFNEGIVCGGGEWSEQPLELFELVKEASEQGLKIMIYTGGEIEQFHARIGQACADKVGMGEMLKKKFTDENDRLMYAYIGSQVLDYYIPTDYYIKTGKYDFNRPSIDRVHFGVALASENQQIIKIAKVVE